VTAVPDEPVTTFETYLMSYPGIGPRKSTTMRS
jgi:hypothetical protein